MEMALKEKATESTGNQLFLLLPHCFLSYKTQISQSEQELNCRLPSL